MTSHVFTEDQKTMEWYIDGIPVAELKRRYEAHDALVAGLELSLPYLGKAMCDAGFDSEINIIRQDMEIIEKAIAAAAEVRNG